MDEEITISLGPKERILIDEILKSSLLGISTTEEALLWSLGVAKLFLVELEKLISLDPSTKVSEPFSIPGIKSVPAPSPMLNPFSIPGIKPVPAPSPQLKPFSIPGIEPVPAPSPMIRIRLEESEVEPKSVASDFDLPNLDSG